MREEEGRRNRMGKGKDGKLDILNIAEGVRSAALKLSVVSTGMGEHPCQEDKDFYEGLEGILNDQVESLKRLASKTFELGQPVDRKTA